MFGGVVVLTTDEVHARHVIVSPNNPGSITKPSINGQRVADMNEGVLGVADAEIGQAEHTVRFSDEIIGGAAFEGRQTLPAPIASVAVFGNRHTETCLQQTPLAVLSGQRNTQRLLLQ